MITPIIIGVPTFLTGCLVGYMGKRSDAKKPDLSRTITIRVDSTEARKELNELQQIANNLKETFKSLKTSATGEEKQS